jgi:hypothetical protein
MDQPVEVIPLAGFDPEGEPEVRRTHAGGLWLVFNFLPPSWAPEAEGRDLGWWADFDRRLERALGVPVTWEDREFFRIRRPQADTVEAIRRFLVEVRKERDPGPAAAAG